jgi:hypothetical protein
MRVENATKVMFTEDGIQVHGGESAESRSAPGAAGVTVQFSGVGKSELLEIF